MGQAYQDFSRQGKKTMEYTIKGTGTKTTKRIDAIFEFIGAEFSKGGKRLGYDKFVKNLSKWSDENKTVFASTIPTHKEIQTACYLYYTANKGAEFLPLFTSDGKNSGVVMSVKASEFDPSAYDKNKERESAFDPMKLIQGLLNSEKYSEYWTAEKLSALADIVADKIVE